jgi:hypothetical protein
MRKLFAISLILAAIVMSLLVFSGPATVSASSVIAQSKPTATPTVSIINRPPPAGALPVVGADRSDSSALLLIGVGGLLLATGLIIRSRRHTSA